MLAAHVAREAARASRLVDDLLTMARVDRGLELSRADLDLRSLVTAEAERVPLVHPSLRIRTEIPDAAVPVHADPDRVAQVLSNLIENAARATGRTGRVTVAVERRGSTAAVVVTDDGPGVPPADRERIFERLVRLDDARTASGGVGLGLPIARGIARAHGGDVRCVDSDRGARFEVTLPLEQRTAG